MHQYTPFCFYTVRLTFCLFFSVFFSSFVLNKDRSGITLWRIIRYSLRRRNICYCFKVDYITCNIWRKKWKNVIKTWIKIGIYKLLPVYITRVEFIKQIFKTLFPLKSTRWCQKLRRTWSAYYVFMTWWKSWNRRAGFKFRPLSLHSLSH